jgi:hypothetical protein
MVVKISELNAGTALAGTEPIPMVQGGDTEATTPAAIKTYVLSDTSSLIPTNGASVNFAANMELLADVSSGAVTTDLLPAGCILLGLSTYVTDTITGSGVTGYTVGDGSDPDRWGEAAAVSIGTTTTIADWTAVGIVLTSALDVTITAVGGTFTAGAVRVVAHYVDSTAITG